LCLKLLLCDCCKLSFYAPYFRVSSIGHRVRAATSGSNGEEKNSEKKEKKAEEVLGAPGFRHCSTYSFLLEVSPSSRFLRRWVRPDKKTKSRLREDKQTTPLFRSFTDIIYRFGQLRLHGFDSHGGEVASEETDSFNMFGVREHICKTNCLKSEASIHNKPRIGC